MADASAPPEDETGQGHGAGILEYSAENSAIRGYLGVRCDTPCTQIFLIRNGRPEPTQGVRRRRIAYFSGFSATADVN